MKLLFLDVDGVLNTHEMDEEVLCGQIHNEKVRLLNYVLRETGARIVMSSAWRYLVHRGEMNLQGLDWLLRSHGVLAGRLVGITRPDTMERGPFDGKTWPQTNERGRQIADYLRVCPGTLGMSAERYAVVDDLDLGITEAGHPFVQTAPTVGLTSRHANALVKILNQEGR